MPPWSSLARYSSLSIRPLAPLLIRTTPKPWLALPVLKTVLASTRCLHAGKPASTHTAIWREDKSHHGSYPSRTHNCGELRVNHDGQEVVLCGWAQYIRALSSDLTFIPIRDAFGTTQLVFRADASAADSAVIKTVLQDLTVESVICAVGTVMKRPSEMINKSLPTGQIEIQIKSLYILNSAGQLPFLPSQPTLPNEELRLKHRYLDLRRPSLQSNLRTRSLSAATIRNFLIDKGFVEVETPTLFKSTPEGAREYIVPTRDPGAFYALPQSPQQHKQLLMAAGLDRYFQIARCFRDEDLRADRQPEFTQVDLEMSFVTARDIQALIEELVKTVWRKVLGVELGKDAFSRMTYQDAMSRYGSDKPDTRFAMEINDISSYLPDITTDSALDCFVVKRGAALTGTEIKSLEGIVGDPNIKDIATAKVTDANRDGSWIAKTVLTRRSVHVDTAREALSLRLGAEAGDLVVVNKRPKFLSGSNTPLGRIRLQAASLLQSKGLLTIDPSLYNFLWVESFPLFSPDDNPAPGRTWTSTHHPFTAPVAEDVELLVEKPEEVRGQHYDLVLNGVEIGGGSIRIHSPALQTWIFENVLKLTKEECSRFDHLIDALGCGCPPHGGIALGFDRLMSIICRTPSIRDVIAFPKAAGGKDFVVGSPSRLGAEQLRKYGLRLLEEGE